MTIFSNGRLNRMGSTRVVLELGSRVYKAPSLVEWRLFLCGLLQNMQEVAHSRTRHPKLCPVLWSLPGGFLVCMPRARVLTIEEFLEVDFEAFRGDGLKEDYVVPVENKADSLGWLDGNLVAVDYG